MSSIFAGGYFAYLSFLVFLVGGLLFAQLLVVREDTGLDGCRRALPAVWSQMCPSTIATGYAAGAAAVYNGHHGADLATVTAVNDIRNFGFILCAGLVGVFALSVAAAARLTGALPRWVTVSGATVGCR